MKIFRRSVFSLFLLAGISGITWGADYGLPSGIQEGNILHCFNWPASEIKAALPSIAAAGFGSVQLSPSSVATSRPVHRGMTSTVPMTWHSRHRLSVRSRI